MLCRTRWLGLEQEGFGIVFLEAAACGVPVIAGASGGAGEAVADGETGVVLHDPANVDQAADALEALFDDEEKRQAMGNKARQRAVAEFGYDQLSRTLREALQ